jgi:hypothetical protein
VGTTLNVTGVATFSATPIYSSLTASSAVATDASKALVSVTNTGTGNNVLATSPTLVTPILGTPASGSLVNCTDTNYTGFKNRIINGAMVIDQRNAGAAVTPTNTDYTLDRWQYSATQASKFTVQRGSASLSVLANTGLNNYMYNAVAATATLAAGDLFTQRQAIEGFNISDFQWGTANAKPVTLSFWVYTSVTGTHSGSFSNGAGNRCYVFSFSVPSANTWTYVSVTVAGDTSGTWVADNTAGLYLRLNLGAGSTYLGSTGSWGSTLFVGATGSQQVVTVSGGTFHFTGVQLEKGSTSTSFDYRPIGTELALCQRYFEKSYLDGTAVGTFSAGDTNSVRFDPAVTSQNVMVGINFAARKRASPTMTAYDAAFNAGKTSYFVAGWNNNGATGAWNPYQSGATISLTGVTGAFAFSFAWIASSEL